ncbi:hypothetical protein AWZ03_012495 [Drosophila navojoa]|uniref:Uncharacterized protein n=1 Tax=Drosophila navojoa TaxID=7232 RepID=A0A484AXF8_DRONA|nr:hypothetical protein AWZ03_012495 [Drosophila navojoa]
MTRFHSQNGKCSSSRRALERAASCQLLTSESAEPLRDPKFNWNPLHLCDIRAKRWLTLPTAVQCRGESAAGEGMRDWDTGNGTGNN